VSVKNSTVKLICRVVGWLNKAIPVSLSIVWKQLTTVISFHLHFTSATVTVVSQNFRLVFFNEVNNGSTNTVVELHMFTNCIQCCKFLHRQISTIG